MVNAEQPARSKPPLTRRVKFGIGATVVSLVILVYPGMMALPLTALIPLMPRMQGCANFGAPLVFLAFFALAFLLSGLLIGSGIVAVVLVALRKRIGILGAVVLNAAVCSLLLMAPLDYSAKADSEGFSLYVLLAIFALVPAAALVLLLSPRVFSSWALASRPFIAAAVATVLFLLPGAAGVVALGFQARNLYAPQPAAVQPASSVSSRAGC